MTVCCKWAFPFCRAEEGGGDSYGGAALAQLARQPTSSIPKVAEWT